MEQSHIGTLGEGPLHAALKEWYAQPGDLWEAPVDGYHIDLVRGELLIEIQTGNFSSARRKLEKLTLTHPVRLVYPIPLEKYILRLGEGGEVLGRRRSPKRGEPLDVFWELVRLPGLLSREGFSLELVLIEEEEVRVQDPKRGWRRGHWVIHERRLLEIIDGLEFSCPAELLTLLPEGLPEPFTTAELSTALGKSRRFAQAMAYSLTAEGALTRVGKKGRAWEYGRDAPEE